MDAQQLQQIPLFHDVPLSDLEALFTLMPRQSYAARQLILEAQSLGNRMYIVVSGQVRIYTQEAHGYELTISLLGAGQVFGELSLLDEEPRSANVSAKTDVEL